MYHLVPYAQYRQLMHDSYRWQQYQLGQRPLTVLLAVLLLACVVALIVTAVENRRHEQENRQIKEINRELHAECDRLHEGHKIALATLAASGAKEAVPDNLSYTECEERIHKAAAEWCRTQSLSVEECGKGGRA